MAGAGRGGRGGLTPEEQQRQREARLKIFNDVLEVYRARWQVELVLKQRKQRLRLNQIRSQHRMSVEATVRALLIAWALHESTTTWLRTLLRATAAPWLRWRW